MRVNTLAGSALIGVSRVEGFFLHVTDENGLGKMDWGWGWNVVYMRDVYS